MMNAADYAPRSASRRLAFYTDLQRAIDAQEVQRIALGQHDGRSPAEANVMMRLDHLLSAQIRLAQAQIDAAAPNRMPGAAQQ